MIGCKKALEILEPVIALEAVYGRKHELSRRSSVNKSLRYFGLILSALDKRTETTEWKKNLTTAREVLHEVSIKFPITKEFIEEQKQLKENISLVGVIYISLTSLGEKN